MQQMGEKMNQTAKADAGKLQLTLVPPQIIEDVAEVRMYGNKKYHDPNNWKQVEIERYRDALFRHFVAYIRDPQSVDEESGIPHYKHMATNMAFICAMERSDWEYEIQRNKSKAKRGERLADERSNRICGLQRLRGMLRQWREALSRR